MLRGASRALVLLSLAAASLWSGAAPAQAGGTVAATTYYVSPDGPRNTVPCPQTEPCYLFVPLAAQEPGDTIILEPGEYQPPPQVPMGTTINLLDEHVTLEGEPGQPAPKLFSKVSAGPAVRLEGFRTALRNVVIEDSGVEDGWPTLIAFDEAGIDHAIMRSTTNERAACMGYDLTITDSVCAGKYGFYVSTAGSLPQTIGLRNSDLYGTEDGMLLAGTGKLDLTADAVNSIIRSAGTDIDTEPMAAGDAVHLVLEHSDFGFIVLSGGGETTTSETGNVSAAPLFVNRAGGDFREAPGSPTIDAGLDDPLNGPTDLAGNPRAIGPHADIGAYEFLIAPAAETGAASGVATTAATLSGTVDPNGLASTAEFRYGTSTAYGSTLGVPNPGAGTAPVAVSAALTGLTPGTTYHYALLATTAEGTAVGADRTFTTPSATVAQTLHPGGALTLEPVLSNLRISPVSLRAARPGRKRTGATVTYTLSEPSQVGFAVETSRPGRRGRGGRCVAPAPSNRTARSCRRTITLGRFSRSGTAGTNRFHLTGVLAHGALPPGSYLLAARPKSGTLTGAARSVRFRVVR